MLEMESKPSLSVGYNPIPGETQEELRARLEDYHDCIDARWTLKQTAEGDWIPWERVKGDLGL